MTEGLKVGDTIECADADEVINIMQELTKHGIETDFLYQKNGAEGLWLEVIAHRRKRSGTQRTGITNQ